MEQFFTRKVLGNPFHNSHSTQEIWAAEGLWQPQWAMQGGQDVDLVT